VLKVGYVAANPRTGAMVEVTKWPEIGGPGQVQIRRRLRPGMGFRIPHVHLLMDETFYVEYGVADFRVGHRRGRLAQGQQFRVPRYEVHVNPLNRSTSDVVLLQTLEAAKTDALKRYVIALTEFIAQGRDVHGDLPPAVAAAIFAGKDQQTFLPWLSRGLQRSLVFPVAKQVETRRAERRRLRNARESASAHSPWDEW
jgi:mannose-6-phosphate isomerase-like protein (cupin superfamily)